jgi:predicted nucleic acid-binding protein
LKVLVDTSVWVDFFNGHPSPQANTLAALIRDEVDIVTCGVIAAEVLQGFRSARTVAVIERHFSEMEWLTPAEPATYLAAAALFRELRSRGTTIRSTIDCLIACLADAGGALLLHKDRDLDRILESRLVRARAVPSLST